MRISIASVLALALGSVIFAPNASAQVTPQIKNQTGAPLQILDAQCSSRQQGGEQCQATLQFAASATKWNAYGLRWDVTFENGDKKTARSSSDRSLPPVGIGGGVFTPGQSFQTTLVGFGMKDHGVDIHVASVEVEVDFAMSVTGSVWGDMNSPAYQQMTHFRNGYFAALKRLGEVYATEGPDAVHKVLEAHQR